MATEQEHNSPKQPGAKSLWFSDRVDEAKLLSKTVVALIFIVNSVALGLYALDLVKPNETTAAVFGAISFTFAAIVLWTFVHQGVKFQTSNKRKR